MLFSALQIIIKILQKFNKTTLKVLIFYYLTFGLGILSFFIFPESPFRDYFLYVSILAVANHYLPLPVTAMVYYMGQSDANLYIIAFTGALATSSANSLEYYLLSHFQNTRPINALKKKKFYLYLEKYFQSSPFFLLASANILPIPIDPVRWLAVISNYSIWKFYYANLFGRFLRYCFLVALAKSFPIPTEILLYVGLGFLLLSFLKYLFSSIIPKELNSNKNQ